MMSELHHAQDTLDGFLIFIFWHAGIFRVVVFDRLIRQIIGNESVEIDDSPIRYAKLLNVRIVMVLS